jgi:hypothetical protein
VDTANCPVEEAVYLGVDRVRTAGREGLVSRDDCRLTKVRFAAILESQGAEREDRRF